MSVLNSLARTESGGNFAAQNQEAGWGGRAGHFGRLQFGHARLEDAKRAGVIPADMTPQQFMADRAAQERTEQWHKRDMMNQAERLGLTQYIGQTVGGIPITMDAILAMGHLGGMGGARDFLRSGGRDNPSDSFGTSLADYARIHGNAPQRPAQPATTPTPQHQNAMMQVPVQDQAMQNKLALMQRFQPQANVLNVADYQSRRSTQPLMGFGVGQNPFVRR